MKNEKKLIGLLRIRNEELILEDTLNHMSTFCDYIYVYDDCSEDDTRKILINYKKVTYCIFNNTWNPNQIKIQGKQRHDLFEYAKFKHKNDNFIYMDADERIDFDFNKWDKESAVIMNLYDARMTENDFKPYEKGELINFRKYFDKLERKIPFIFNSKAFYKGVDCERYPQIDKSSQNVINEGYVQHYGKALSKKHWQDTCNYYSKYLEIYREKWQARKKESGIADSKECITWNDILKIK